MVLELAVDASMSYRDSLVTALAAVVDRLALHVEYEKYEDGHQNFIDKHALRFSEFTLASVRGGYSVSDWNIVEALRASTDRLRLHTALHQYDDEEENTADIDALTDAESILN